MNLKNPKNLESLVITIIVVPTALTKLSEVTVYATVPRDTLEPHPTADLNVSLALIVLHSWPVWSTSARTPVWADVE